MMIASERITQIQTPTVPPGTRNGRWWSGYFFRSGMIAGSMKKYMSAVSEITSVTMTVKKLARLPLLSRKTRATNTEPMMAETTFMITGVPVRLLNLPSHSGPAPSRPATACTRTAPCSHTPPALMIVRMISTPMK